MRYWIQTEQPLPWCNGTDWGVWAMPRKAFRILDEYGEKGPRKLSYLSSIKYDEVIGIWPWLNKSEKRPYYSHVKRLAIGVVLSTIEQDDIFTTLHGVIPLDSQMLLKRKMLLRVQALSAIANRVGGFGKKIWSQNIVQFHSQNKFQNDSNCTICNTDNCSGLQGSRTQCLPQASESIIPALTTRGVRWSGRSACHARPTVNLLMFASTLA